MGQPKPIPEPPWESVAQGWEALTYSPGGLSLAGSLRHIPCLPLRAEDSSARQASRFSLRAPQCWLCLTPSFLLVLPGLCLHPFILSSDVCPFSLFSIFLPPRHRFPTVWPHSRSCALLLHSLLSTFFAPFGAAQKAVGRSLWAGCWWSSSS